MTSSNQILIRLETESDAPTIEKVISTAFLNAEHTNHNEQFIVRNLRESNHLSISLVAYDKPTNTIIGHAAISSIKISTGHENWYGLGPVSVLPQYQRNGIGSLLIERALEILQNYYHAAGCVVLGNPGYYTRFGFRTVSSLKLAGVPSECFLAITWHEPTPTAMVSYHEAFEASK